MILSDRSIKDEIRRGRLIIDPLDSNCIQPASVDVRLDRRLLICRTNRHQPYIDLRQDLNDLNELVELVQDRQQISGTNGTYR
jgi:dCTP deaminase